MQKWSVEQRVSYEDLETRLNDLEKSGHTDIQIFPANIYVMIVSRKEHAIQEQVSDKKVQGAIQQGKDLGRKAPRVATGNPKPKQAT